MILTLNEFARLSRRIFRVTVLSRRTRRLEKLFSSLVTSELRLWSF